MSAEKAAQERDAQLRAEVITIRSRDVDAEVLRQINAREGNCTTAEVAEWTNNAYRRWRERWPALNSLLFGLSDES